MKAFLIIFFTMVLFTANAQNIGEQYITSVYSPLTQSRICLVSENPHPQCPDTIRYFVSNDTLEFEVEKKWSDHIVWIPMYVNQGMVLESTYLANFSTTNYTYVCRNNECRWMLPEVQADSTSLTLTYFAEWDWPSFVLKITEKYMTRTDAIKLMKDGEVLKKEYTYEEPNYWFH